MSLRRLHDAPLRQHNTFGVEARAGLLIACDDAADLPALLTGELAEATARGDAPLVLGGGSNLLLVDGPRIALRLDTQTIRTLHRDDSRADDRSTDDSSAIVRADAGASWHGLVLWSLQHGYAGLENLALIPGTVGAAPIQNIGAYGVEVGERIHAVEAIDRNTGDLRRFSAADCAFAYRDSVFKQAPNRWLIVAVEFVLADARSVGADSLRIDYAGIREELASGSNGARAANIPIDAQAVADAVIRLRQRKLPDPAVLGNAGSFFKNPIVPTALADALKAEHPVLPVFPAGSEALRKLSAAWLIDACGWRGHREPSGSGDAGVAPQHALVLVNHGRASGAELLALARRIAESVQARFGVEIEPEPRIVGARW